MAMEVAPPSDQICNLAMWRCKWCNLVANFGTNASGDTLWPIFEPMQVVPFTRGTTWWPNLRPMQVSPSGSAWDQFRIFLAEKDFSSCGLNTMGPLCLWECLTYLKIFVNFQQKKLVLEDNVDNFWQCFDNFYNLLTLLSTLDNFDFHFTILTIFYKVWQFWTILDNLSTFFFEKIVETLRNLRSWQSLWPDNKVWHRTAFAILAMFIPSLDSFLCQKNACWTRVNPNSFVNSVPFVISGQMFLTSKRRQ